MHIKCSFCDKVLAKSETKNCGRCKAVIYCSRECQKGSWGMNHKEICARLSDPQNDNDELHLWCTFWSPSFVYATLWALDIKNNPGHNMKHALMVFVKKTARSQSHPARRYKIIGGCLIPISTPILKWHDVERVTPNQFYLSVQDPVADDGFRFLWNNPAGNIYPSMLPKPRLALLAKLAIPILRHMTETVSPVDAMAMWDPDVWLNAPHPLVRPEEITVLPEEIALLPEEIALTMR